MTEHQPETNEKEVVRVHVEYKDKDGNVYSMNDVEVPVQEKVVKKSRIIIRYRRYKYCI